MIPKACHNWNFALAVCMCGSACIAANVEAGRYRLADSYCTYRPSQSDWLQTTYM